MWWRLILAVVPSIASFFLTKLRTWLAKRNATASENAIENAPIDRSELEQKLGNHDL